MLLAEETLNDAFELEDNEEDKVDEWDELEEEVVKFRVLLVHNGIAASMAISMFWSATKNEACPDFWKLEQNCWISVMEAAMRIISLVRFNF